MFDNAVGFVERRLLSRRRMSTRLLIVVIAVASGAVMATAAGARRSSTSFDRLLAWSNPPDAVTGGMGADSSAQAGAILDAAARLPGVTSSLRSVLIGDGVRLADGRTYFGTVYPYAFDLSNPVMGRFKPLRGRLPSPDKADEASVGFVTAELLGLHVGDRVEILFGAPGEPGSTTDSVTIVGIAAYPAEFPSLTGRAGKAIILTPAFQAAHPERVDWTNANLNVHLAGADAAAAARFRQAIAAAGLPIDDIDSVHEQAIGARRVVSVEAGTLWLVAIIVGAATLLILFQLMRRDASLFTSQLHELGELGMTRRELLLAGALRGLRVGSIGAAFGVILAVAVSPGLPIGTSRTADPNIGIHADLVVIGIGLAVAIGAATVASAAGVRAAARRSPLVPRRASPVSSLLSRLGPVGSTGARLAFTSPGRSAEGSRLSLGTSIITLALLIGSVSLETSFDHLLATPPLVGATWDVVLSYDDPSDRGPAAQRLAAEPEVETWAPGGWVGATVNGHPVFAMVLDMGRGIDVAVDRGRQPQGPTEIALGAAEMADLHVKPGDEVSITLPPGNDGSTPAPLTVAVTGRAIMASPVYLSLPLGRGAAIPLGLYERLGGHKSDLPSFLVKLRPGAPLDSGGAALVDHLHPNFSFPRPENIGISSLDNLKTAINILLLILAALCTTSFLHAFLVKTKRNRRDMATMRSLGLTGRQANRAHLFHGGLAAAATVVVAVPLAISAATFTWRWVAEYMGAVARPVASIPTTTTIAAATIAVGIVVAKLVGWREQRRPPSELMHGE
jgi:hypothetical protein